MTSIYCEHLDAECFDFGNCHKCKYKPSEMIDEMNSESMNEKYVKVDDIIEYCTTYSALLQNKGQGVAQAALRRVKEFAKENVTDLQPVKHGQWREIYHDSENYSASCSFCQEPTVRRVWFRPYDFCPHCGARMDLKEGEKDGRI